MEKKIGKNVSSGAKKVEKVEKKSNKKISPESVDAATEKKPVKASAERKKNTAAAVMREKKAADERVDAAKKRVDKKEQKLERRAEYKRKKLEKRAALKEKKLARREMIAKKKLERKERRLERRAALKEKKLERRAARASRREMLKSESKSEKQKRLAREKKERLALRRSKQEARAQARANKLKAREAARERRAEERRHRRELRNERRKRENGFGGWLAAVITLGTACLALATIVTAGAIRMNDMNLSAESGYRANLFEMVSSAEGMENSLDKLRVASGTEEQRELLTDVLLDSAVMENALEKIPFELSTGNEVSGLVNRTGNYCRMLLGKLAAGETLTAREREGIAGLYEINAALCRELNEIATHASEKDFRSFLAGKGSLTEKFSQMGESVKKGLEEIAHAPFAARGNVGENKLEQLEEVSSARAEELAKEYLASYRVKEAKYTGETLAPDIACYNFVLTAEDGNEIFAEITKKGGKLAFFDTYEECTQKNFSLEECDALAREYLAGLGYENLEAVWLSEGGMVANLTYVGNDGGVRAYPDTVRVRVCESKGRVTGVDMKAYLLNHEERNLEAKIGEEEAQKALSEELTPTACHLALITVHGRERLAYEFACDCGEEQFLSYVSAETGEEIALYRVRQSAQGSYLE